MSDRLIGNKIHIAIGLIILFSILLFLFYPAYVRENCNINGCSGFDLKCEVEEPIICMQLYKPGDVCRKFVTCKASGLSCETIASDDYKKCTGCFENCRNSEAPANCTLACDEEFRKDIYPDIRK